MRSWPQVKIKLLYIVMALIPLVIVCFFVVAEVHEAEQHEVEKNIEITKSNAGFIENLVLEKVREAGSLTQNHELTELHTEHLVMALRSFKTDENQDYFITNPDSIILASTRETAFSKIPETSKNQYFQRALTKEPQVASQVRSIFSGDYVVTIYAPIRNAQGHVIGVLGSELPFSFFQKYLGPVKIGDTGLLCLVDQNGYFIYDKLIPGKQELIQAPWYEDIPFIERQSVRTGQMTYYSGVRMKKLGWYMLGLQRSSEITAAGLAILLKDAIVLVMSVIALITIWLYKTALVNRNRLVSRQSAEKLTLVSELAAGMAHEIRNPLTTIRGFSQILQNTKTGENHREFFELIMQSVDHIDRIVKETLLLSKPQQMKISTINLRDTLEETLSFMIDEALLQEVNVVREIDRQEVFVRGDPDNIKLVLIKILKNSLEATPRHGTIKIKLEPPAGRTVKIRISDTGEGIKPAILQKVGTPFFTTKAQGTGLGLLVCQRLIKEHGGSLNIKSKEGLGTTVTIELPVA